MKLREIEQAFQGPLSSYTGAMVIMLEQDAPKPPYPFIGYKFTTVFNPEPGLPIEETNLVKSNEQQFEYDIEQKLIIMPTITLSITAYSNDIDQSHSLALKAREWFFHAGYETLKDLGIIVAQLMNIDNRSVLLEVFREYRMGFDCIMRATNESTIIVPAIESITFKGVIK